MNNVKDDNVCVYVRWKYDFLLMTISDYGKLWWVSIVMVWYLVRSTWLSLHGTSMLWNTWYDEFVSWLVDLGPSTWCMKGMWMWNLDLVDLDTFVLNEWKGWKSRIDKPKLVPFMNDYRRYYRAYREPVDLSMVPILDESRTLS